MIKIVLLLLTSIFIISCSRANISYKDKDTLQISIDSKIVVQELVKPIYENRVHLSNINIYQNVFILDNIPVTYENIQLDAGYQLSYGVNRVIGIAFADYSYTLLDQTANFQFYKLSNKQETIYLIAQNLNKKALKLLYGWNKKLFQRVQQSLLKSTTLTKLQVSNSTQQKVANGSLYIKSNWSEKNIILDNLVTKIGGQIVVR